MGEAKLKEYINSLDESKLRHQVIEMCQLIPEVKEYYNLKINPMLEEKLLEEYKSLIKSEFYSYRGKIRVSYSEISDIIRKFKEKVTMADKIAELMLFYVDLGIELTNEYGEMEEEFYINVEATFNKAISHINKHGLKEIFNNRLRDIISKILLFDEDFKNNMSNILNSYNL